jgi:hypothetical protein
MSTIPRSFRIALIAALTMVGALPSLTWAIPTNSHYMVSPASCQPAESSDSAVSAATSANRLWLINGVWSFRPGSTGAAELACPINFSGAAGVWDRVQLWYRDGFTAVGSGNGFVEGDLMMRQRGAPGTTLLSFTASPFGNGQEYGLHTDLSLPAGHPDKFLMYYLRVRMWRANANHEVAFTGYVSLSSSSTGRIPDSELSPRE